MPSQNSGIAYSVRLMPVLARSNVLPLDQPPRIPMAMPMTADRTVAVVSSTRVGHT